MDTVTGPSSESSKRGRPMTMRTLIPFLALTFGLTWGLAALVILFTDQITAIFGEIGLSNTLVILAVCAASWQVAACISRPSLG